MEIVTTSLTGVAHLRAGIQTLADRGAAIAVSTQFIIFALHVGSTAVLARLLTPGDFGLVAMVAIFTGAILIFQDLGLAQATIQAEHLSEPQLSALFWLNLGLGAILSLLVVVLAPVISLFYGRSELIGITEVAALALIAQALSAQHRALLIRQMRFGALRLADVLSTVFGSGVAVVLAILGYGYWSLAFMPLATAAAFAAFIWPVAGWFPGRPRMVEGVGGLLKVGLEITTFNGLNYLSRNADDLLIGWAWGSNALGFYTRAYELMMFPLKLLNVPLSPVAIATLSRLTNDGQAYRNAYRRIGEKILLIALPIVGLLIGMAHWVIELLLGPGWEEASDVFFWLGIAALYQPLAHSAGWLFISQGRTREYARWGLISSPIIVLSFFVGLPFGPVGVAASYAVTGLCVRIPVLFWLIGRRGYVDSHLLWRLLLTFLPLAIWTATISYVVSLQLIPIGAGPGLIVTVPITILLTAPFLALVPVYRNAMSDFVHRKA